ncbi:MAG TPA: glycosyltransferase family A protein [Candidatus Acidoferrales bacterium]|nr:glycosyltransferase family A protein [Candidatus Acidoferrales bacterium]
MKATVVIPTYNNEATIAGAIDSALAQRFDGQFEVVVVDDGSTDRTHSILERFGDRIRRIDQPNRGVAAARNVGLAAATGEFVALLDGDDAWREDKLAKTIPTLEQDPTCVAVFSDAIQIDGAGEVVVPNFVEPRCAHAPTLDEMLAHAWPILPSAIVVRRTALMEAGGFSEQFGPRAYGGEDVFAFMLLRELGAIRYVPEKLVRYRLSAFIENLAKRVHALDGDGRQTQDLGDPERLFDGYLIFARLVRDRYGARGRTLTELSIKTVGLGLVGVGLMAIHEGNRARARQCYRASLRYRPLDLKTYVRLGWTMLPAGIADSLTTMLTPRLRRGLAGPPFHILSDRVQ